MLLYKPPPAETRLTVYRRRKVPAQAPLTATVPPDLDMILTPEIDF